MPEELGKLYPQIQIATVMPPTERSRKSKNQIEQDLFLGVQTAHGFIVRPQLLENVDCPYRSCV